MNFDAVSSKQPTLTRCNF